MRLLGCHGGLRLRWMTDSTEDRTDPALFAAVEAAFKDVLANPSKYDPASVQSLPTQKRDFPKLVVMDSCHWINLWYAHTDHRRATDGYRNALRTLRVSIGSGRVVVACTDTNLMEIAAWHDEAERVSGIEFLVDLSQNHSLVSALVMRDGETMVSVLRLYKRLEVQPTLRTGVLRLGMEYALGAVNRQTGDPGTDKLLRMVSLHPRLTVAAVARTHDAVVKTKRDVQPLFEKAKKVRELDQSLNYNERLRRELEVSYAECTPQLLAPLGVDRDAFAQWLGSYENRKAFWGSVPSVDVSLKLFMTQQKNVDAIIEANDVQDIQLLQLGIPYANIVVTEKPWAHVTQQAKLDRQYNTTVLSTLGALEDALREHDCLPPTS